MEKEIWKDVADYEGLYQVSNFGRIRTCEDKTTYTKRHGIRHWKQRVLKPKICKASKSKFRYDARVDLWKDGKHKTFLVARLVAITFLGNSNLTVNHKDGNSLNNNVENLEWCSLGENIRKGFDIGLYPQIKVSLINKITNEQYIFRSMSLASSFIQKSSSYISSCIKRNKFENETYKWSIYEEGNIND